MLTRCEVERLISESNEVKQLGHFGVELGGAMLLSRRFEVATQRLF